MNSRAARTAAVLALGVPLLPVSAADSGLVKYRDWPKSPEFVHLATDEDRGEWSRVGGDEEAAKFVALFWARRDPDPKTPANEFRERFEKLVQRADEHFGLIGTRGALTERGKIFILLGPPKSVGVAAGTLPHPESFATIGGSAFTRGENPPGTTIGEFLTTFIYEAQQMPAWAGARSLVVKFAVEQTRDDVLEKPAEVRRIENAAMKAALVNPALRELPKSAAPARPASAPAALSPKAAEALEAAFAKEPSGTASVMPLTHSDGVTRLMMQVYLEGAAPAPPVRMAWLVRAKDGRELARAEEELPARPALKGVVLDKAIPIAAGDLEVAVVVLDGTGAVVHAARRVATVPAAATSLHASELFLAVGALEAGTKEPSDAFVFGDRKYVARGDGSVMTTDGLTYLLRLHGPGIDPSTKKALLKPRVRIQPKGKKAMELPAGPDEGVPVIEGAKGELPIVDIAGTLADANIGEYFKPGEYVFTVSVEDAVGKTTVEASRPFTVVAPPKK